MINPKDMRWQLALLLGIDQKDVHRTKTGWHYKNGDRWINICKELQNAAEVIYKRGERAMKVSKNDPLVKAIIGE